MLQSKNERRKFVFYYSGKTFLFSSSFFGKIKKRKEENGVNNVCGAYEKS
jgi:hypothetical protein